MANEILYTTLGDLRLPAVLAGEVDLLLADRSYLWGNPALLYRGDAGGSGSDTVKYPRLGLGGYDEMAAVAENAAVVPTQLTDASVTLAVARQSIARTMSDLARITDPMGGRINVSALAADIVQSAYARFTSMIAALGGGFSTTAGSTGVNLSVDNWFTAVAALELANVSGPYVATLHSVQIADLRTLIGEFLAELDAKEAALREKYESVAVAAVVMQSVAVVVVIVVMQSVAVAAVTMQSVAVVVV